jgi:midasin
VICNIYCGTVQAGLGPNTAMPSNFTLEAPTAYTNSMRVVRACQLSKLILLEGSPGIGKTSLTGALASVAHHQLCMINLSDQSDIMGLFDADLPIEGGLP